MNEPCLSFRNCKQCNPYSYEIGESAFLMLLMILFFTDGFSHSKAVLNVTGSVVEQGSDTPIEQATVRLLNVKDSAMVRGVVSARNGSFTLKNVKKGSYLLHITFIGYDPLYQPLQITGKKNPVNVGKLELSDGDRVGEKP